ncbi:transcription termination/antitermination protein NusA [bacterium]|nr:transcription termination/antitermination protein NusA [bacterium]
MDQTKFMQAISQIAEEKSLTKDKILETVEQALAAAYRKDYGNKEQVIRVDMDEVTGAMDIFQVFEVVEEVENPEAQKTGNEAQDIKKGAKVGDTVEISLPQPQGFGRIAAQTAKQVIIQRIREAERDVVMSEYAGKEGELVNGVVQRLEGRNVIVDIGKANGIMFPSGQIEGERYRVGQRMKVVIEKVEQTSRGPQIMLSRTHSELIIRLFELEVPEIGAGTVEIKSIAREAGSRTKIAVFSTKEGVDPVGSCVGQRGTRVQAVIAELTNEKIDCVLWDEDPVNYLVNALSPAKVTKVGTNEKERKAQIFVPEDQLSLAIGKNGQNVRLAVKLTGWDIDVVAEEPKKEKKAKEEDKSDDKKAKSEKDETSEVDKPAVEKEDKKENSAKEEIKDEALKEDKKEAVEVKEKK